MIKAAISKESGASWPSDTFTSPSVLLPFLSEASELEYVRESLVVGPYTTSPKVISRVAHGELLVAAHYKGLELFLAVALGFMAKRISGAIMPELLSEGAYRHLYEIDRILSAQGWLAGEGFRAGDSLVSGDRKVRRVSYIIDKGAAVWEMTSTMFGGLTFQAGGDGCTFSTELIGYNLGFSGPSLEELFAPKALVLFQDAFFYLDGDLVTDLVGFKLTLANGLQAQTTRDTGEFIGEPGRVTPAIVNGTFALPFYRDATLQSLVMEPLAGLLEFIGPIIPGTNETFVLRFYFPELKITSFDLAATGPERVQQVYTFVSSPGNDQVANVKRGPLLIEVINDISEHPLLD